MRPSPAARQQVDSEHAPVALERPDHRKVQNFRALRKVELKDLRPITVLLGPNGSGKSTVFDVFAFLAECFELGLRRAWDKRGRAKELKSRGADGAVTLEIKYREPGYPLITYHLSVDERGAGPVVMEEWLRWKRGSHGAPFRFLEYHEGRGRAVSGELPDEQDTRLEIPLKSPDLLAVNALGQFAEHPRVAALHPSVPGSKKLGSCSSGSRWPNGTDLTLGGSRTLGSSAPRDTPDIFTLRRQATAGIAAIRPRCRPR